MFENMQFFFDFLAVFYHQLNPVSILLSIVKYAALGFILGLVLVIVCAKCKFFKRQNKYWNIFAKLYYVYIPIVCIGGGVALSLLQSFKESNNAVVNTTLAPVNMRVISFLHGLPSETRNNLSVASLKEIIRNTIAQHFKNADTADNLGVVARTKANLFILWISDFVANAVIDEVNTKITATTGLEKESVNKLWEENLIDIFKKGFLNDFVSQSLNKQIRELQNALLYFLLFLISIPAVDILIAKWLEKRNANQQGSLDKRSAIRG